MIEVNEGGYVKFVCDSQEAIYPEHIKWYKLRMDEYDGLIEELVNDEERRTDKDGNLWFTNVQLEDDSYHGGIETPYYCTYSSPTYYQQFNGSQIYLKVIPVDEQGASPLTQLYTSPNHLKLDENKNVKLYCIYAGHPLYIDWYYNGEKLESRAGTYIIDISFPDKSGFYACNVSNDDHFIIHEFRVDIETKLNFNEIESYIILPEGNNTELTCITNINDTSVEYNWFINTEPISKFELNDRWTVTPNKIIISNLQPSDMCVIGCKAEYKNQSNYKGTNMRVISKSPCFENKDKVNVKYFKGYNESLISIVDDVGPYPDLKCTKNGQEIKSNNKIEILIFSLELYNLTQDESGVYECTASNKYGSDTIKRVLTVYQRPHFYDEGKTVFTKVGDTITLPCRYESGDDPSLKLI